MANPEESSPLMKHLDGLEHAPATVEKTPPPPPPTVAPMAPGKVPAGWTVDGLPLTHGSVLGSPVRRNHWDSGLFSCLGRNDEFCSSDFEVCLLGTFAPCVLFGSNAERLGAGPGSFANNCMPYAGLYMLGNFLFGSNCLAPWFSHPTRTAIRRRFNLEGSFEAFTRSCGLCGSVVEDEVKRENLEVVCDFTTHYFCHLCSLCQEGRELRRRLPHPGFNGQPILVMMPPMEQTMERPN